MSEIEEQDSVVLHQATRSDKPRFGISEGIVAAIILSLSGILAAVMPGYLENRSLNKAKITEFAEKTILNQDPQDFRLVALSNVTRFGYTESGQRSEHWKYVETANIGDVVAVNIYYHNNGPVPAYGVRAKATINRCNGEEDCYLICASLESKNSNSVSDCARLLVEKNSGLMVGSWGAWNVAQSPDGRHLLPGGQTGAELTSRHGLLLGDICEGWDCQGNFVTRVTVSREPNKAEAYRGSGEASQPRGKYSK